ncbi:MAG: low molecular weight phosphotyrosine protein phosphatase [Deltaproteobacteria bacterium]|jgi:protein-tyrosine phosphatase|nr:low molecular weight phosphotyrosine protein phosphatase [Deltaproteobacteria bacterium]MBW2383741.1 low molecular weight phosphotyrosine protein phosphatase [Deltaproteobacteria bacterium]MBW2696118.1 low molecular weight phosphotyrosine protein phosphatase [Deltaproteobacteria bacterium]
MYRLCFVCLGNICRSPTAEGIMVTLVEEAGLASKIRVDSAGTSAWHVGEPADQRSRDCAERRGVRLPSISRQFVVEDFERFHYVLAMDRDNRVDLRALASDPVAEDRIHLLRSFDTASKHEPDVPDPYYAGDAGFDRVFDICAAACRGLLDHVVERHGLGA